MSLSSQKWRDWSNLTAKSRSCGGMQLLAGECFSLRLQPVCSCSRVSKEWAALGEARISPGYMQAGAFWEGPVGLLSPLLSLLSSRQLLFVLCLIELGREPPVRKGSTGWGRCMQVLFKSLALGLFYSRCQAQVTRFSSFLILSGSNFPSRLASGARMSGWREL